MTSADPRLDPLRSVLINLQDTPADQDEDFLAELSYLAQKIKGCVDTGRLRRALEGL